MSIEDLLNQFRNLFVHSVGTIQANFTKLKNYPRLYEIPNNDKTLRAVSHTVYSNLEIALKNSVDAEKFTHLMNEHLLDCIHRRGALIRNIQSINSDLEEILAIKSMPYDQFHADVYLQKVKLYLIAIFRNAAEMYFKTLSRYSKADRASYLARYFGGYAKIIFKDDEVMPGVFVIEDQVIFPDDHRLEKMTSKELIKLIDDADGLSYLSETLIKIHQEDALLQNAIILEVDRGFFKNKYHLKMTPYVLDFEKKVSNLESQTELFNRIEANKLSWENKFLSITLRMAEYQHEIYQTTVLYDERNAAVRKKIAAIKSNLGRIKNQQIKLDEKIRTQSSSLNLFVRAKKEMQTYDLDTEGQSARLLRDKSHVLNAKFNYLMQTKLTIENAIQDFNKEIKALNRSIVLAEVDTGESQDLKLLAKKNVQLRARVSNLKNNLDTVSVTLDWMAHQKEALGIRIKEAEFNELVRFKESQLDCALALLDLIKHAVSFENVQFWNEKVNKAGLFSGSTTSILQYPVPGGIKELFSVFFSIDRNGMITDKLPINEDNAPFLLQQLNAISNKRLEMNSSVWYRFFVKRDRFMNDFYDEMRRLLKKEYLEPDLVAHFKSKFLQPAGALVCLRRP